MPKQDLLDKHGPQLLVALSFLALSMSRFSSTRDQLEVDDQLWMAQEVAQKEERLHELIDMAEQILIGSSDIIDVEEILEALRDLQTGESVKHAFKVASMALVHDLEIYLSLEKVAEMSDITLNMAPRLLHDAHLHGLDTKSLTLILAPALTKCHAILNRRLSSQFFKAMSLLERAKSQIPAMIAATMLSAFYGVVMSYKTQYSSELIRILYEKATGNLRNKSVRSVIRSLIYSEIVSQLALFVSTKAKSLGTDDFILGIKTELFRAFISQDLAFFEKSDLFDTRSTIGNADYTLGKLFDFPVNLITSISCFTTTCTVLYSQSRKLSFLMCIVLPLRFMAARKLDSLQELLVQSIKSSNHTVAIEGMQDIWTTLVNPTAVKTLKSFAREPLETSMFSQHLKAQFRTKNDESQLYSLFSLLEGFLERGVDVLTLSYGGYIAMRGEIQAADLAAFASSSMSAFAIGESIYFSVAELCRYGGDLDEVEKIFDLLHSKPTIGVDHPPLADMPLDSQMDWTLEFDHVSFSYPTRLNTKILKSVSFEISQGEKVGILG